MAILARLQAQLDGAGEAEVRAQPSGPEAWRITRISLQGNSTAQPSVAIYRGSVEASRFVDGSGAANSDMGEFQAITIWPADALVARWSLGTPGATMQMVLEGVYGAF